MRPAFRTGDYSICAADINPGAAGAGSPNVLAGGASVIRVGDLGHYEGCCDNADIPWRALEGHSMVLVNDREMVSTGLKTAHPHSIGHTLGGASNVLVGGSCMNVFERARADGLKLIDNAIASLERWDKKDRANFRTWFGPDDEQHRREVQEKLYQTRDGLSKANIVAGSGDKLAHVDPGDSSTINMDDKFWSRGRTGTDGQAGTAVHEATHFDDGADASDNRAYWGLGEGVYGHKDCKQLAADDPAKARTNADNYEYFCENAPSAIAQ